MNEIWKDIKGFEGRYQVSNLGRIKSLAWLGNEGKIGFLKGWYNGKGYLCVRLDRSRSVHGIVAETFIGPRPEGLTIDHINKNKKDNRLTNLRYLSNTENVRRSVCKSVAIEKDGEIYKLKSATEACNFIGCAPSTFSIQAKLNKKVKGWSVSYE